MIKIYNKPGSLYFWFAVTLKAVLQGLLCVKQHWPLGRTSWAYTHIWDSGNKISTSHRARATAVLYPQIEVLVFNRIFDLIGKTKKLVTGCEGSVRGECCDEIGWVWKHRAYGYKLNSSCVGISKGEYLIL